MQGIDHRLCRNKRGGSPREHKTRLQNKVPTPVPFVEAHGRLGQVPVLFPGLNVKHDATRQSHSRLRRKDGEPVVSPISMIATLALLSGALRDRQLSHEGQISSPTEPMPTDDT